VATTPGQDVRELILKEATGLFMKKGYKGLSMREIALAANLSKAGLYYHFKDKEHLFLEILKRNLEGFVPKFRHVHANGKNTQQKLELLVLEFMKTSEHDRAIAHLAEREMIHVSQAEQKQFSEIYQAYFLRPIMEILQAGHAQGELHCPDAFFATRVFLGMCWPFLMSHGAKMHGKLSEPEATALAHVFMHGFARQSANSLT
jgi:AcrR family transcriptional regulator